ncbi:MAG: hypothetical protein HY314_03390 [Acidobacteria bacterium]|nr:hypothetical protein [Acidobacteriota bacterium]
MGKYELNGSHRRVLAIRLRAVGEVVTSIRQAFDRRPDGGLLLKHIDPVPGELAAYLNPQLEKLDLLLAEAIRLIESTLSAGDGRQPTSEAKLRQKPDQAGASR